MRSKILPAICDPSFLAFDVRVLRVLLWHYPSGSRLTLGPESATGSVGGRAGDVACRICDAI